MTHSFNASVPQRRGLAITSLILSIASFVLICAGPLLSIPGIIMGFVAHSRAGRDSQYGGGGMALAAIIVGFFNVVATPIVWILASPFLLGGIAVVLPAFANAREAAKRTVDAANVHAILATVEIYAAENGGTYPPHLAAIASHLEPKHLVSKSSTTAPLPSIPAGKPWTDFAADVDAHCDFIYIGTDLTAARLRDPANTIIIYETDVYHGKGRTVGFGDGHVLWLPPAQLRLAFDDSNHARASAGLPPVDLDGPPHHRAPHTHCHGEAAPRLPLRTKPAAASTGIQAPLRRQRRAPSPSPTERSPTNRPSFTRILTLRSRRSKHARRPAQQHPDLMRQRFSQTKIERYHMSDNLSHLDPAGAARMVDVSEKSATRRHAVAEGFVLMAAATLDALRNNSGPKGEVLSVARIAGIQAAKRTGELIPLCHPLPVEQVTVDFEVRPPAQIRILASAIITAKTGIEMEAYTAVAVAGLTVIDMLKAIDPAMQITGIRLLEKTGGKSDYHAK